MWSIISVWKRKPLKIVQRISLPTTKTQNSRKDQGEKQRHDRVDNTV